MSQTLDSVCEECGAAMCFERSNYRYTESGLANVVLQGVEVATCGQCGNFEVRIPRMAKLHRAIAQALMNSPVRLGGGQLRFLRTYLGLSGAELGRYLHTDKTKISKWERGGRIGPSTDRLVRLLAAALDEELRPGVSAVAAHLPHIADSVDKDWELHVDVETLQTSFLAVSVAA